MIFGELESFLKVAERVKSWFGRKAASQPQSVASRFVQLFESHGVHRNQIPRFFGHGLVVADIKENESLLPKLSEELLNAVCELFAVRREWLDGAEEQAHPDHDFYKDPEGFAKFLDGLRANNPDTRLTGILLIPQEQTDEPVSLFILEVPVGWVGDRQICRFHRCNNWLFSYWKSRAYLTACMAIAWKRRVYIHSSTAPVDYLARLSSGEVLLGAAEPGIHQILGSE